MLINTPSRYQCWKCDEWHTTTTPRHYVEALGIKTKRLSPLDRLLRRDK